MRSQSSRIWSTGSWSTKPLIIQGSTSCRGVIPRLSTCFATSGSASCFQAQQSLSLRLYLSSPYAIRVECLQSQIRKASCGVHRSDHSRYINKFWVLLAHCFNSSDYSCALQLICKAVDRPWQHQLQEGHSRALHMLCYLWSCLLHAAGAHVKTVL